MSRACKRCWIRQRAARIHVDIAKRAESDITFIIVPTPSDADGAFSNEYMLAVVEQLGGLSGEKQYHVVVVTSTVMPGHRKVIREMLERASGSRVGAGMGLSTIRNSWRWEASSKICCDPISC